MPIDMEQTARFEAAHRACRIVAEHGVADGVAILKGYMAAYLRAIAAVEGWDSARHLIQQQLRSPSVPASARKIQIVVSNTADVVHVRRVV